MQESYRLNPGNPASQHQLGNQARRELENARTSIATVLGADIQSADGESLVFTSGATEANNLAIKGLVGSQPGKIVTSAIEHPSLLDSANHLKQAGWDLQHVSVDSTGILDLDHAASCITPDTQLVSIMLGNHETGALQPVKEISALCRSADALLHTDATQAVGKIPVDFRDLGVDALTFSAHKFHGPASIGGLLLKHGTVLHPLFHGGLQQLAMRPGTESVALAVGMQVALNLCKQGAPSHEESVLGMRNLFEKMLQEKLPWISITSQGGPRLPHVSNIAFPGLNRQALMMALDLAGVACSTGSACASGSTDPSPVLQAMGLAEELVESALRFSFGRHNLPAECQLAANIVEASATHLKGTNPLEKTVSQPPQEAPKQL
jgi:cysteine desulfurase